jgi:hypothetical protein
VHRLTDLSDLDIALHRYGEGQDFFSTRGHGFSRLDSLGSFDKREEEPGAKGAEGEEGGGRENGGVKGGEDGFGDMLNLMHSEIVVVGRQGRSESEGKGGDKSVNGKDYYNSSLKRSKNISTEGRERLIDMRKKGAQTGL